MIITPLICYYVDNQRLPLCKNIINLPSVLSTAIATRLRWPPAQFLHTYDRFNHKCNAHLNFCQHWFLGLFNAGYTINKKKPHFCSMISNFKGNSLKLKKKIVCGTQTTLNQLFHKPSPHHSLVHISVALTTIHLVFLYIVVTLEPMPAVFRLVF